MRSPGCSGSSSPPKRARPRHTSRRSIATRTYPGVRGQGRLAALPRALHRNALAHAGKKQRRMVIAAIATAFAQETADAAHLQW
jgi:hypothetical protein